MTVPQGARRHSPTLNPAGNPGASFMSMLWTPNLKTVVLILQMRTVGPREVKHHPRSVTLKGQNQAQHWKSDP